MPGPHAAAAPIVGLAGPVGPSRRTTILVGVAAVAARLGCPTRLIDLQDDRLPPDDGPPLRSDGTIGAEREATIAARTEELAAAVEVQRTTGSGNAGR